MRRDPGVDHCDALTAPGRERVSSGQTQPLGLGVADAVL